jgi:hypothetical protein
LSASCSAFTFCSIALSNSAENSKLVIFTSLIINPLSDNLSSSLVVIDSLTSSLFVIKSDALKLAVADLILSSITG